jgi:hypothetical protein
MQGAWRYRDQKYIQKQLAPRPRQVALPPISQITAYCKRTSRGSAAAVHLRRDLKEVLVGEEEHGRRRR